MNELLSTRMTKEKIIPVNPALWKPSFLNIIKNDINFRKKMHKAFHRNKKILRNSALRMTVRKDRINSKLVIQQFLQNWNTLVRICLGWKKSYGKIVMCWSIFFQSENLKNYQIFWEISLRQKNFLCNSQQIGITLLCLGP